jgi:hypothetical protein
MALSDLNKEYLKFTKQEATKWHFYLGGDPAVRQGINSDSFDWGTDVNVLYRIRENDVNFVTNRYDWTENIVALPWNPTLSETDRAIYFNRLNNIAYLCVSDNAENRSDSTIRGKKQSKIIPSHKNGLQSYSDGYSWYALFTIDPEQFDLITPTKIPVRSIDDFTTEPTATSTTQKYSQLCGTGYTAEGTCCLYNKEETKDSIGVTFAKGSLSHVKLATTCYRCTELAKKLNYEYVFKAGFTSPAIYPTCAPCDCSITVDDKITTIGKNLDALNYSSFYRHIYANYQGWEDISEILSVFINLDGLSDEQITLSSPNPKVTFDSITGTNAEAQLITQEVGTNQHKVLSISLLSRGKNYNVGDAVPKITGFESSILNSRIEVNVAPEDFPENPISVVNNLETCIKVSISNTMLEDSETNIRNFSRYGIIKDVKLADNNTRASDSLNTNQYQFLRATTVMTMSVTGPINTVALS